MNTEPKSIDGSGNIFVNLELEDADEDDESPAQSFREGWADVVAGNTIPASKLWD
jgi:hypothetical protein